MKTFDLILILILLSVPVLLGFMYFETQEYKKYTKACEEINSDKEFCNNAYIVCNLDLSTLRRD